MLIPKDREAGFTVIELAVALALIGLAFTVVFAIVVFILHHWHHLHL